VASFDFQLTDNKAGALRLLQTVTEPISDEADEPTQTSEKVIVQDLVGWGDAAPCSLLSPAAIPGSGKSLQRYLDCATNLPIMTGNNGADFAVSATPAFEVLSGPLTAECTPEDDSSAPDDPAAMTCEGVIISEVLPNPDGADAGHEFIELFNPTSEVISLDGCSLQTTANARTYGLDGRTLQPGEYLSLSDAMTGLTLQNSAGGKVWLLTPTSELEAAQYPAGLGDDMAWAKFGDVWQTTYQPTPGQPNIAMSEKACPAGQTRSQTSGRCISEVSVVTAAANQLTPCKSGQERNPETNRCRSALSVATALAPCASGQERSPDTNRCRAVAGATSSLAPCKAGQGRNPETNRCRKIEATAAAASGSAVKGIGTVKDVAVGMQGSLTGWWLAGLLALGAVGYAAYEWRQELVGRLKTAKDRLFSNGSRH
jgi:hypothetical protein